MSLKTCQFVRLIKTTCSQNLSALLIKPKYSVLNQSEAVEFVRSRYGIQDCDLIDAYKVAGNMKHLSNCSWSSVILEVIFRGRRCSRKEIQT